jgi:pimeloyl-ACP methyl ester carboxylesterase
MLPDMTNERDASSAFSRPHAFVAAGEKSLAYWRFGSGPDVVFIHGWPLHSATFRRIVPALAKRFTLHLFDLPGVGHSESHGPVSFASHTAAVRSAVDTLGLTRYALVAHDSGGVIARLLCADDPRVSGLVIAGTEIPRHRPKYFGTYVRLSKLPGFATLLLASMQLGILRRSVLGFGGCFTDPTYVDDEFSELFVRPLLGSRRVAEGHLAMLRQLDFRFIDTLEHVHARIRAPVQCIWGTRDPFFPSRRRARWLGSSAATRSSARLLVDGSSRTRIIPRNSSRTRCRSWREPMRARGRGFPWNARLRSVHRPSSLVQRRSRDGSRAANANR